MSPTANHLKAFSESLSPLLNCPNLSTTALRFSADPLSLEDAALSLPIHSLHKISAIDRAVLASTVLSTEVRILSAKLRANQGVRAVNAGCGVGI